ncbi:MAG: hypothetical protein P8X89_18595 [Reinekea sp.]
MPPKNWGEPMGAPTIFGRQIEIKLLHPASTLESRIQVIFYVEYFIFNDKKMARKSGQTIVALTKSYRGST